jgi:hypothetical protein
MVFLRSPLAENLGPGHTSGVADAVRAQLDELKALLGPRQVSAAARELGVRAGYLHELLKGRKNNPGAALRQRIADYLTKNERDSAGAVARNLSQKYEDAPGAADKKGGRTHGVVEPGEDLVVIPPDSFASSSHRALYNTLVAHLDDIDQVTAEQLRGVVMAAVTKRSRGQRTARERRSGTKER